MLTQITIKNFTIIENLELDLSSGMTVVTGETGAGKSIMIDALELALGGRAESTMVRLGTDRCDITATFDITFIHAAQNWLKEHDLATQDDCILRRCIINDGRSRSFINGQPVPLQLLKELGSFLVNIHGQHEHQTLLKRDAQRKLLDAYANHTDLTDELAEIYKQWRQAQDELTQLQTFSNQRQAQSELVSYQVRELDELALFENELEELNKEHKQLANIGHFIDNCQLALQYLSENEENNATILLQRAHHTLEQVQKVDERIAQATDLLNNAMIDAQEACIELSNYLDNAEINPERLAMIEQRLSDIYDIARKHHVSPEQLSELHQKLKTELQQLENSDERIQSLQVLIRKLHDDYIQVASKLSKNRQTAAKKLSKLITDSMQTLGMIGGKFDIKFEGVNQFSPYGLERIEFVVAANPGQPLQPLIKVASGGELSRISLAIQVITSQCDTSSTLIFDEVDVGIGGGIATIIGQLLRRLGQTTQVLCVTHLAQVASHGHQHLRVNKITQDHATYTEVKQLSNQEKIEEIARMMGGITITRQTLAHAKEMLESV